MELADVLQLLDSTTAVLVLVAILWRLLAQIERAVAFAETLIMRLVLIIEQRNETGVDEL